MELTVIDFLQVDLAAMLACVFATLSCALLGNFLVLRRQSLMGDAISHAVLPGIVVAFLVAGTRDAWPIFLGATAAAIGAAVAIDLVRRFGRLDSGTAMGVVFSILFAFGIVAMEQAAAHNIDLDAECVLYGQLEDILWLTPTDWASLLEWESWADLPREVRTLAIVFAVVVCAVVLFYKELKITSFDPALATTLGIPAGWMNLGLMVLVGAVAVAAFEAVGSILVIAMFICPAASARMFTDRLKTQIWVSLLFGLVAGVGGYIAGAWGPFLFGSEHSLTASGMVAVVSGSLLGLSVLLAPRHGIIARRGRRVVQSRLA